MRGGAFKPRTSPYSFQGLREDGLRFLAEARDETGLPVITEIMDARDLPMVEKYADCLQIGTRNMQNFSLLKEVGRSRSARSAEAGIQRHDQRADHERRIHSERGQYECAPLRTRHSHL